MANRGNGEGSIYFRKDRNIWQAQVTVGHTENGSLKRKTVSGKTRKEVKDKLIELQNELKHGTFREPNKITVAELISDLIEEDKALNIIGDDAYLRKKHSLSIIAKNPLGNIPVQSASDQNIKNFLYSITDYSNSVISKTFQLLRRCFREAVHKHIISENIMANIRQPKSTQQTVKVRALTLEEQKKLVQTLKTKDIPYAVQMQLMLLTGMRMGEINALDANDIDLRFKVINIRRSVTRNIEEKTVIGKTTKTYAGMRKIPLSEPAVELLTDYMKTYMPNKDNLLFYDYKANKILTTSQVNLQLARVFEKYDILDKNIPGKVSLHSLRHTYATRCIEAGMPAKVLQNLLGHTDIKTTLNTYCDAFGEFKNDSIRKFTEYMRSNDLTG